MRCSIMGIILLFPLREKQYDAPALYEVDVLDLVIVLKDLRNLVRGVVLQFESADCLFLAEELLQPPEV